MGPRTKTQGEVEAPITVANECSQVKRLVSPLLICANQRCFGGRTCSGRIPRFAHSAKRRLEWLLRQVPTVYRKESRPVAKRPYLLGPPTGTPLGFLSYLKKGPGFHRTPARDGLTKRLKRSFLLLLRGLLGGLLRGLLRGLLLCHHALPPLLKDMDPIGSIGLAGSMWW